MYQYFLHVVPTTYIPPRSRPLNIVLRIFFKFDLDPIAITVYQKNDVAHPITHSVRSFPRSTVFWMLINSIVDVSVS